MASALDDDEEGAMSPHGGSPVLGKKMAAKQKQ
jgi:hypothetical protein